MDYRHLYVAFWRPDLLAASQAANSPGLAVCDYRGPTSAMVANLQDTTCPACRETFLNACLPTGNGVKLTWFQHVANEQERDRVRRDAEAAKANAWTTPAAPATDPYLAGIMNREPTAWATVPLPIGDPANWRPYPGAQAEHMAEPVKTDTATGWTTPVPANKDDGWR